MSMIYLAGGCFWGMEKYIAAIRGVIATNVGYANGVAEAPTYGEVCTGRTGCAETVRVEYDAAVAPLPFLLDLYFRAIDPTSPNRQGNDMGTQYRTGIYYVDAADRPLIERALARVQSQLDAPVVVEVEPLTSYAPAEKYHQNYLGKNPGGYCHIRGDLFAEAAEAGPQPWHFEEAAGG